MIWVRRQLRRVRAFLGGSTARGGHVGRSTPLGDGAAYCRQCHWVVFLPERNAEAAYLEHVRRDHS